MPLEASNPANRTKLVPSTQLQNEQLYVQGSREYIKLVQQQLLSIQQFGLKKLLYTVRVVEVPSEEASVVVGTWSLAGAVTSLTKEANSGLTFKQNAVVPASFRPSATTFEVRLSDSLSDEQINELVGLGKVISSPKIANLHDGIKLDLTGTFDDMRETVRLEYRLAHSQLRGMDSFTYESNDGLLTVQQPQLSISAIQITCQAPINKTIAKATESISTIILIQCQEYKAESN